MSVESQNTYARTNANADAGTDVGAGGNAGGNAGAQVEFAACEADIRARLLTALREEKLLVGGGETTAEEFGGEETGGGETGGEGWGLGARGIGRQKAPAQLLRALADEGLLRIAPTNLERACEEIADSVVGLQRARAGLASRWDRAVSEHPAHSDGAGDFTRLVDQLRARCDGPATPSDVLARFEQIVCDGHPSHPGAKTSLGIGQSWRDILPEQVESFELRFVAVTPDRLCSEGQGILDALRDQVPGLAGELAAELNRRGFTCYDPASPGRGGDAREVIPVHPFQWDNVISHEFADEIAAGEITLLDTTAPAQPLMSVRTVRVRDLGGHDQTRVPGAVHIKLALEVQLTGAIRGISAGAVAAPRVGAALSQVLELDTGFNPRTVDDEPAFSIARDIAAVRWNAQSGIRAHCFGALIRQDPACDAGPDDVVLPVAALLARNPLTGRPVLSDLVAELDGGKERVKEWFERLTRIACVPPAALLARWGVALEPHPQNTVLVLRDGLPYRVIVRDLGGCRVWASAAINAVAPLADELFGLALVEQDLYRLVDKMFYPLVANLLRHLIASNATARGCQDEIYRTTASQLAREYWRTRAAKLATPTASFEVVFHRLLGDKMPVKRVLGMRLSGAVTEQDYVYAPNPLAHGDMLSGSFIEGMVAAQREWAQQHLDNRLGITAGQEGLTATDLAPLRADIANARDNLALVRHQVEHRARSAGISAGRAVAGAAGARSYWDLLRGLPLCEVVTAADSLAVSGHNVHPLAKLRRGFSLEDSFAYGPESGLPVDLRLVAVRTGVLTGAATADFGAVFATHFAAHVGAARAHLQSHGMDPDDYVVIPVHPWQLEHVINTAFGEEKASGAIVIIPHFTLAARPTISLRTLVPHAPDSCGERPFLKCAVDVTLTSTRRSISTASAVGTPQVARLVEQGLRQLGTELGISPRVRVVPEITGVALAATSADDSARRRGLSALMREDIAGHLAPGQVAVSASALRGHEGLVPSPLADVDESFFDNYVADITHTVLGLMFFKGIALEQHLQNTLVVFDLNESRARECGARERGARYSGLLLRDFSGLRAWRPRLSTWANPDATFAHEAMTITDDYEEFVNKGFYALIFGNLDGLIKEYAACHDVTERQLWEKVKGGIGKLMATLPVPVPARDLEWMRRSSLQRKGFLSMALASHTSGEAGDIYLEMTNPLAS